MRRLALPTHLLLLLCGCDIDGPSSTVDDDGTLAESPDSTLSTPPRAAQSTGCDPTGACPSPGHIEVTLDSAVDARRVNRKTVRLLQNGSLVASSIGYDASSGIISVVPASPLDGEVPFELQLTADLAAKMEPYGPLWITPGDPDCDTSAEFQVDDDADGIPDCAEKVGTYHWGMPLNFWGARVDQTDIFVEIAAMSDPPNDPGFDKPWMRPWPQALDKVRDAFAQHGYALHFDVGDLYEDDQHDGYDEGESWAGVFNLDGEDHRVPWAANLTWAAPEPACDDPCPPFDVDGWASWPGVNEPDPLFLDYVAASTVAMPGREKSFYYVLFAHQADVQTSGRTIRRARHSVITLGQAPSFALGPVAEHYNSPTTLEEQRNKIINMQAGTLMHEMGHMFGLQEGGDENLVGKPNYLSVMSYVYQTTGLPTSDAGLEARYRNYQANFVSPSTCGPMWLSDLTPFGGPLGDPDSFVIDYAGASMHDEGMFVPTHDIVETNLDETHGIGPVPWGMNTAMNWNCDGDPNDVGFSRNVTGKGVYTDEQDMCATTFQVRATDTSRDHDDWGNLELYHQVHFTSGDWPNDGLPFQCPRPMP